MDHAAKLDNRKWKIGLVAAIWKFWRGLREWSGDSAYETYVRCAARQQAAKVLSREEFYVEQLKRRYARVSRCC